MDVTIFRDIIAFNFPLDYPVCLLIPLTKLFSQKVKLDEENEETKNTEGTELWYGWKTIFFFLKAKSVCSG